jgi:CubicO group peptidase (beta-lactamase class C family)
MRQIRPLSIAFLIAAFSLTAASLPSSKPEDVGLSSERLQRIHALVQRHMDLGDITGAVILVARKGQVAFVEAQGTMDVETKRPMTRDSVFRMASMTKPVIGTAIMMMLEEGKLQLGDPVSKYISEFKNMKVAVPQGPGGRGAANPPKFYSVPAEHDITIKDLLTHTSGLSSGPMGQSEVAKNRRKPTDTLADYVPRLGATPLEFQPGSRWMYSPSDGFDVPASRWIGS